MRREARGRPVEGRVLVEGIGADRHVDRERNPQRGRPRQYAERRVRGVGLDEKLAERYWYKSGR